MAEVTREIPRSEWHSHFDDFSRDLPALAATVEVLGSEVGAQVEAAESRLTGITYDQKDDILVIGLDAPGGAQEDLEHIVYQPQKILLAEAEGSEIVYDVEDDEHVQTILRLTPAAS